MRKIFQIIAIFFALSIFGQTVSDFRYVIIPETFKNEKSNRYDLNDLLLTKLKEKKYTILYENKMSWPQNAVENPCTILNAELIDVSSIFKNIIQLKLFDCNGKEISSINGKSNIKDLELGMRDALENILENISPSNASNKNLSLKMEKDSVTSNTELPVFVNVTGKNRDFTVGTIIKAEDIAPKKVEIYSNGILILNKINLEGGAFELTNLNNSTKFGIFKPSTKTDVFRIQLNDNSTTIGYFENENIVVELPNADGTFRKEIFVRK